MARKKQRGSSAAKPSAPPIPDELVKKYQAAKTAGRRQYARADRLLHELARFVAPGQEFALASGRKAKLVDRFADADGRGVIFTPCAARRWDLEVSP